MSETAPFSAIAEQLRSARIDQGLALDRLAPELRVPRTVLEAIENGEWARLGAPIYVRHQVGRYAARLGVTIDLEQAAAALEPPRLSPQPQSGRIGRMADFTTRQAAYVGGTLLVLPLLYFAFHLRSADVVDTRALDLPPAVAVVEVQPMTAAAAAPAVPVQPSPGPLVAAAPNATLQAGLAPALGGMAMVELHFREDSWIEIYARDGTLIEQALARAGESRRHPLQRVGRVTVGNVTGTELRIDGSVMNLDAVRSANVARFTLSSEGLIETATR